MRKIATFCIVAIFCVSLQGCAKEPAHSYIESKLAGGIETWLLNTCEPEKWCEPYIEVAAKNCLAEHLDLDALYELPTDAIDEQMGQVYDEVSYCALKKVHELHAQALQKDI